DPKPDPDALGQRHGHPHPDCLGDPDAESDFVAHRNDDFYCHIHGFGYGHELPYVDPLYQRHADRVGHAFGDHHGHGNRHGHGHKHGHAQRTNDKVQQPQRDSGGRGPDHLHHFLHEHGLDRE